MRPPRPVTGTSRRRRRQRGNRALVAGFALALLPATAAWVRPEPVSTTVVVVNGRTVRLHRATATAPASAAVGRPGDSLLPAPAAALAVAASATDTPTRLTVADALAAGRLTATQGDIRSVLTRRVVSHTSPYVTVDGGPALLSTPLRAGDRVQVSRGPDLTETLVARAAAGPAGGLPDVERQLWHPAPAPAPILVGALSGEVAPASSPPAPPVPARPETAKVVALTFDDGPDPKWTPQVLAILADEKVPATFCLVGRLAARNPQLATAEVAQGHTVCNHTADHDEGLNKADHGRVVDEIGRGTDLVRAASGVTPQIYRPPGGTLSPDIISVAHANNQRVMYWSVDPSDYLRPPEPVLLQRILSKVGPGAIILLHDGGGDRSQTVAVLRPLIDALKAQGYGFTTPLGETPAA
ncbi:MAG: polysaccharide deacetylase family protein [Acidimicrobiales bacterium]